MVAEAIVIGYGLSKGASPGSGARTSVGSIHLGLYDDGELIPVGGIGAWSDAAGTGAVRVLRGPAGPGRRSRRWPG